MFLVAASSLSYRLLLWYTSNSWSVVHVLLPVLLLEPDLLLLLLHSSISMGLLLGVPK
jgi:hypothetical protein